MKKTFILCTLLLLVLIIIGFSRNLKEAEIVLLAAELVGFEVNEEELNEEGGKIVNTSSKQIGVVTYIKPETNEFVALGHSLTNCREGKQINALCYDVELSDSKYSTKKIASLDKENPIGYVYYDSYCGIYGEINKVNVPQYEEVETANRYSIKKGKANIFLRLDGEKMESFEVEIIATNYIDANKNIRIKITDETLINQTGGIVQGMSGTPVIQNGKLIGAINSVNAQDATDTYAIFIDKII